MAGPGPHRGRAADALAAQVSHDSPAGALLTVQRLAGNKATGKLLRDPRTKSDADDVALYFAKLTGDEPVTPDALADWVHRNLAKGERWLEEQIRGSHEFTGSVNARRYWANYLRENLEVLLAISAAHLAAATERTRKQIEAERRQDAQVLVEAFSKKTHAGDYARLNGHFHAVYDPKAGTLIVTVPVQFEFVDSDIRRVNVTNAGKPDQKVEFVSEHVTWGGDESETWKKKLIARVEPFWSRHVLECTRPGWESLRARVIVRVDEVPLKEPRPDVYPFQIKVHRGDTPSGTEYVTKGHAEFAYAAVDPDPAIGGAIVALHEFGHLLGLDDEYNRGGDSSGIMFTMTGKVLVEYGDVFRSALSQISGINEWNLRLN